MFLPSCCLLLFRGWGWQPAAEQACVPLRAGCAAEINRAGCSAVDSNKPPLFYCNIAISCMSSCQARPVLRPFFFFPLHAKKHAAHRRHHESRCRHAANLTLRHRCRARRFHASDCAARAQRRSGNATTFLGVVPVWEPAWNMSLSTMSYLCNYTRTIDPVVLQRDWAGCF